MKVRIIVHGLDREACTYFLPVSEWSDDMCVAVGQLFGAILMELVP